MSKEGPLPTNTESQSRSRDEAFARALDVLDNISRAETPAEQLDPPQTNSSYEKLDADPTYVTYSVDAVSVLGAGAAFDAAMAEVAASDPLVSAEPAVAFEAAVDDADAAESVVKVEDDVDFSREFDLDDVTKALADLGSLTGSAADNSSAFRDFTDAADAKAGFTFRKDPLQKARDWQIDFGPISGPAGESTVISISPQCDFRGEKITATDTAPTPGTGTRVVSIMIGQRIQKLANERNSTLTAFFAASALANGIKWDTCPRSLQIQVTVSFVQNCTFDMSVFGKAVL